MIDIVLIQPKTPGNIGAIARVMKNFGFANLILINPDCEIDFDAKSRAKHAKDILENARVENFDFLNIYDYKIGTTARLGSDYNIPRSPLTPTELSKKINSLENVKVA